MDFLLANNKAILAGDTDMLASMDQQLHQHLEAHLRKHGKGYGFLEGRATDLMLHANILDISKPGKVAFDEAFRAAGTRHAGHGFGLLAHVKIIRNCSWQLFALVFFIPARWMMPCAELKMIEQMKLEAVTTSWKDAEMISHLG